MKTLILLIAFPIMFAALVSSMDMERSENSLIRLARAAAKQDCRYEKEPWETCDETTGLQRRALKLKATKSSNVQCESLKYITRPCKKVCKYFKGQWSACTDGERSRTDLLRPNQSQGCDEKRVVPRKCKSACRYDKSEWSACENNLKSKTLSLIEGDRKDCEETRTISKQCAGQKSRPKTNKKRNRKKTSNEDDESA